MPKYIDNINRTLQGKWDSTVAVEMTPRVFTKPIIIRPGDTMRIDYKADITNDTADDVVIHDLSIYLNEKHLARKETKDE